MPPEGKIRPLARKVVPLPVRLRLSTAYVRVGLQRRAVEVDLLNLRVHGRGSPRYREPVWIDPSACSEVVRSVNHYHSGQVLGGDWDVEGQPLSTMFKMRACELHWVHGVPWRETGVYEHMMDLIEKHGGRVDGCLTLADVVDRYERLDAMFAEVRSQGRLLSRRERSQRGFRARGEIYIHVGRGPRLLFGGGGIHRFAAARIAGLDCVPAQLGVVHQDVVADWQDVVVRGSRRPVGCGP